MFAPVRQGRDASDSESAPLVQRRDGLGADQEEIIFVLVMVSDEVARNLGQLEVPLVELGHASWAPMLVERPEPLSSMASGGPGLCR